jgi:hypothetical protein
VSLEIVVEGAYQPIRISCSLNEFWRDRIAGNPQLCRFRINCISTAPNVGGGVTRVLPGADITQIKRGSSFVISKQYGHNIKSGVYADAGSEKEGASPGPYSLLVC